MHDTDDLKAARWGTAPEELWLGRDEVHVWRARLNARAAEVEEMLPVLSWRERRRMKRLDKPKQYAAARHMVRTLLGRYLGTPPGKVKFDEAPDGRLVLRGEGGPNFCLATTGSRALMAVSASHKVAVVIDEVPSEAEVSRRMGDMPAREARQLEFLSPQARAQAVVGYQMERLVRERLSAAGGAGEPRVERLKVGGSFVAALAAEGWDWSPSFWRYWRPGERREEAAEDGDEAAADPT